MAISQSVIEKFKRFDPALKLSEKPGPDPEKRGETCMMVKVERRKANGCYEHIGWVRPDLLGDGNMFLNKLHRTDVRTFGGGAKAAAATDEQEAREVERRREERRDNFNQIGRVSYDTHIKRRTGQRINNAGMPGKEVGA